MFLFVPVLGQTTLSRLWRAVGDRLKRMLFLVLLLRDRFHMPGITTPFV
jgi:hypothetical protein